jgi:hypothetical protein
MTYHHHDFKGSPIEVAIAREQKLAEGLRHLAACFEKKFKEPLQINSNGEFLLSIVDPTDPSGVFCGQYEDALASIISPHSPRTGIYPTTFIDGVNGWCWMTHFNVARMLEQFEAKERTFLCTFYGKKAGETGSDYWNPDVEVFSVSTQEKILAALTKAGYENINSLTYTIAEQS